MSHLRTCPESNYVRFRLAESVEMFESLADLEVEKQSKRFWKGNSTDGRLVFCPRIKGRRRSSGLWVLSAGTWQGSPLSKWCLLSQRGLSELDQHACSPGGQETRLWLAVGQLCCGDLLASSAADHWLLISAPWAQE